MKKNSYTGHRPIFTGSPSIVTGGFNLDKTTQNFTVGDVIPAGSLAIYDEQTRKVKILKTGKVVSIEPKSTTTTDPGTLEQTVTPYQVIQLHTDEFYQPFFAIGDSVLKSVSGSFADAPKITKVEKTDTLMKITLSGEIADLVEDDILIEVVDKGGQAVFVGEANSVTIYDVTIKDKYTGIDVSADTMQYELYERRVLPIPESQKDETGSFLKANIHIKLTQS